jgi:excisionase family DNA binding protein
VTAADTSSQAVRGLEALLSLDEVAQLLRISESGVYRLIRSGELPRVKVGSRTLFEPHEIRRFIANRRDAAPERPAQQKTSAEDLEAFDG